MSDEHELFHIGVLRKSGRYPWGTGNTPHQRNKQFLDYVDDMRKKGLSEAAIAEGVGITTTELRANKSIAKNEQKKAAISQATRLKEKGLSNIAIGQKMSLNESSVRQLLDPSIQARADILGATANMLKENVDRHGFIDVGAGSEHHIGVSGTQLSIAVAMLREEGYSFHYVKVPQLGTNKETSLKVLAKPDVPYSEMLKNVDNIHLISNYSEDGGRNYTPIVPPKNVSSKRIAVRYGDEGGADKDGVIELRRGVDDISLGNSRYAQVRVAVDGTHYLKGMAMYSDKMPDGVDMVFNTNKKDTGNKLDAMKGQKDDPENPFSSIVRQRRYTDDAGNEQLSALNIVNEEGDWHKWSKNLSSQMLSKQQPSLAKQQLDMTYDSKKTEFDDIMALTNPAVKKKLLDSFADSADSSAVHLKAAGLPRTRSHVILPITNMKDGEIYAPNYRDGEKVVLIRHPHGGKFEIPELTVNNRNTQAKSVIKNAIDAVGISPKTAAQLSGADFDGDTVLVIPNNSRQVKHSPPLEGLKNFDPQTAYPAYEGMKKMSPRDKQTKMGDASNLITDMTIKGANEAEIARAVRYSMVVIDAEKHNLNHKQARADNGIAELKAKYQGTSRSGAATLISRASSDVRVPIVKPRPAKDGGPIDPVTGKKMFVQTGETYVDKNGKTVVKTFKSSKMAETDDANTLSSGTPMEAVYADHANKLKAIANAARKESFATRPTPYSGTANKAYSAQVASLSAKLNIAQKNAPIERQAQILANSMVNARKQANPDMDPADLKKIKGQELEKARTRTGAKKQRIVITPSEWEAIQAGAISNNKLSNILNNADLDEVKQLAMPRDKPPMNAGKVARAQSMLASGYTQAEVADALGIPASTLNDALTEG